MDLITYCNNTDDLIAELELKFPQYVNVENKQFLIDKTPTIRFENETMSLVRVNDSYIINDLESLQVLGTFEQVFADPQKKEIYDRLYPRTPEVWLDENEVEHTYIPPEEFGKFA